MVSQRTLSSPSGESWPFFLKPRQINEFVFFFEPNSGTDPMDRFLFLSSPTPKVARLVGWPVCSRKRLVRLRAGGPTRHTLTQHTRRLPALLRTSRGRKTSSLHPREVHTSANCMYRYPSIVVLSHTPLHPRPLPRGFCRETFRHAPLVSQRPPVVRGASLSHALDSAD
jgi:hypothetical protein